MSDNTVHSHERFQQHLIFEGLKRDRFRGLSPTDIDGFMDYNGKAFIFFEAKLAGARMSTGQNLAYAHLCGAFHQPDVEVSKLKHVAWTLVFEHNTRPDEHIIAKDQYVIDVFSSISSEWRYPTSNEVIPEFKLDANKKLTLLEAVIQIEDFCIANKINI